MPNPNKGVREYQEVETYFLILDRLRGASYGELAKLYRLDKSNLRKRIRSVAQSGQSTAFGTQGP